MINFEKKAGQFFIVGFKGQEVDQHIKKMIQKYHVGGIILFSRNIKEPSQVAKLTNDLQKLAKKAGYNQPLLICLDQENGIVRRLVNKVSIQPGAMAIAATHDPLNAKKVYAATARELKQLGINWDLAPDADVNSNPQNPVIGVRSFGDNSEIVKKYVQASIKGLQDNKVLACAKHFPGHGNTSTDSHLQLPLIDETYENLKTRDLIPFIAAIESNIKSIMVAHILFKKVDDQFPASLSSKIMSDILRDKLGFKNIIVTDDLEMKAISEKFGVSKAAVLSLKNGADLMMIAHDYEVQEKSIKRVAHAIKDQVISKEKINQSAERITRIKDELSWYCNYQEDVFNQIVSKDRKVAQEVYENSITRIGNRFNLNSKQQMYYVDLTSIKKIGVIDQKRNESLVKIALEKCTNNLNVVQTSKSKETDQLSITKNDVVIICTKNLSSKDSNKINFIRKIVSKTKRVIVFALRNPYDWMFIPHDLCFIALYEESKPEIVIALNKLFANEPFFGTLPVKLRVEEKDE